MANEFIIKIDTDSKGQQVSLENIPIEAAEALKVFIDTLTGVAKLQKNSSDITLSLREGSITTVLTYPDSATEIETELEEVVDGKSYNSDLVKLLRNAQDKIKANGLGYTVTHKVTGKEIVDLTEIFKAKEFTIRKGKRKEWNEEVTFISGRLYISGGKKNANIHLDHGDDDYIIDCTDAEAMRINTLLFKTVYVAALKRWKEGTDPKYRLLDSYIDDKAFSNFKKFYQDVNNKSLERFDIVHDTIVQRVENDTRPDMGVVVKIMRLFNHAQSDRGILRTILITLKPLKDNEIINDMYKNLADILRVGSKYKMI